MPLIKNENLLDALSDIGDLPSVQNLFEYLLTKLQILLEVGVHLEFITRTDKNHYTLPNKQLVCNEEQNKNFYLVKPSNFDQHLNKRSVSSAPSRGRNKNQRRISAGGTNRNRRTIRRPEQLGAKTIKHTRRRR